MDDEEERTIKRFPLQREADPELVAFFEENATISGEKMVVLQFVSDAVSETLKTFGLEGCRMVLDTLMGLNELMLDKVERGELPDTFTEATMHEHSEATSNEFRQRKRPN